MSKRSVRKYVDDAGQKLGLIKSRDLAVGDRIMNTHVGRFMPAVKSVEVREGKQTIVFADGRSATYTLKKDGTWIIDASEAS